jgi:hypothetical protein
MIHTGIPAIIAPPAVKGNSTCVTVTETEKIPIAMATIEITNVIPPSIHIRLVNDNLPAMELLFH